MWPPAGGDTRATMWDGRPRPSDCRKRHGNGQTPAAASEMRPYLPCAPRIRAAHPRQLAMRSRNLAFVLRTEIFRPNAALIAPEVITSAIDTFRRISPLRRTSALLKQ